MRSNAYCGNLLWQSSLTRQDPVRPRQAPLYPTKSWSWHVCLSSLKNSSTAVSGTGRGRKGS